MDAHEPGSPAAVRSPRAASAGTWSAARSTRWGDAASAAPGRATERHGRRPPVGRVRRHLLGGLVQGAAAGRSQVADLGFRGLVPLFLGAVALALPAGTTTLPRARLLIDAVVLPASLALLAYLVLGRSGAAQTPTDHHILLALVYPAAYLGVAFGAI